MKLNNFSLIYILLFLSVSISAQHPTWESISKQQFVYLYAGNLPTNSSLYKNAIGLSLKAANKNHMQHDITNPMPLPDNFVDMYQSEDVFEHIEYNKLASIINEIYRVLKPGGLLRISIPDYKCKLLRDRSIKDISNKIIFDPQGGGNFKNGKVINGGHVWFPVIENVKALLEKTHFFKKGKIEYLHYYDTNGVFKHKKIDYSKGYIQRTPDNDHRVKNPYKGMSLVVDLYK